MYTVYGDIQSGNCYKIKLLLTLLGLPHRWHHMDIMQKQTRTPDYLAKNPNGKVPLLEMPDGRTLAESNAILNFLAEGTHYFPHDPWLRAQVMQWQFFEQYDHEPTVAVARFIVHYQGSPAERQQELATKQQGAKKALAVMDQHLAKHDYFVGHNLTNADISLYAYTHVADEGNISLADYPAIQRWLQRVAQTPGYISLAQAAEQLK
ncbi:MAG: glutathione S-transferase family protein [Pseudomonadota bacterium]